MPFDSVSIEGRITIGIRVSPALKRKLLAAAEKNGRSLSEEVEIRLNRSFEEADDAA